MTSQPTMGAICPREPLTLAGAQLRASRQRSRLYDAFAFFRDHAGSAADAIDLARAELWARDQKAAGLVRVRWEDDADPESWEPDNVCVCGEDSCAYCAEGKCPESVEVCIAEYRRPESVDENYRCATCGEWADDCPHWEIAACVGGFVDLDSDARRYHAASLALEAMGAV
jgi:hypothetical protein